MIIKIKYIELICFDDRNNDYVKDSDVSEVVLNYQISCKN